MEGPSNRRKIRDVSKSERDKKTSETLYGNPWRWLGIKRLLYHNIRIIGRIALLYWVLTTWSDCVVCVALIFRQDTRVIVTTKLHQVEMPAFYLYSLHAWRWYITCYWYRLAFQAGLVHTICLDLVPFGKEFTNTEFHMRTERTFFKMTRFDLMICAIYSTSQVKIQVTLSFQVKNLFTSCGVFYGYNLLS